MTRRARHRLRRVVVSGSVLAHQVCDAVRTAGRRFHVGTAWIVATPASTRVMATYLRRELERAGLRTRVLLPGELGQVARGGFVDGVPDVAIVRGLRRADVAAYRELERRGVRLMNPVDATLHAKSKVQTARVLHALGVEHPRSIAVRQVGELVAAGRALGWPLVVKAEHGFGGQHVWLATGSDEAFRIGRRLFQLDGAERVLAQAFVPGPTARDVRAYVVRGATGRHEVVAAMVRQGPHDDFRSNSPRGLRAWRIAADGSDPQLPSASIRTAVAGARALGLDYAGVDVSIPARDRAGQGGVIFEVNGAAPGFTELDARFPRSEHVMPHLARHAARLAVGH